MIQKSPAKACPEAEPTLAPARSAGEDLRIRKALCLHSLQNPNRILQSL
jgi:hypothetical protein